MVPAHLAPYKSLHRAWIHKVPARGCASGSSLVARTCTPLRHRASAELSLHGLPLCQATAISNALGVRLRLYIRPVDEHTLWP